MELIIGKTAGFCFGVKNAVEKTIEELKNQKKIYCLGELVHNKTVTEELIKQGVVFIDKPEDAEGKLIIRAHGIPIETYQKIEECKLEVKDLTCPKVLHIHNIAEKYKNNNYFIFLVGQREHPETIGTISYCGENSCIIENINDIENAIKIYKKSKKEKALIIAQTTFSLEKFNAIVETINYDIKNLEIKNTICDATKKRQEETIEISKKVDTMIIIGGKNSSNSNKLYEIAKKSCKNVVFIETKNELDLNVVKEAKKIGIMAGASTPQKSVSEVVEIIKKI